MTASGQSEHAQSSGTTFPIWDSQSVAGGRLVLVHVVLAWEAAVLLGPVFLCLGIRPPFSFSKQHNTNDNNTIQHGSIPGFASWSIDLCRSNNSLSPDAIPHLHS
ncbi:hypothetical protein VTJ04DRAFT_3662 [Mycothermus thermophilus]|uniref:uncharacterized protein n=1 Tax=Humicola insolens TaxID=85995 RepID=UPI0037432F64